MENIETIPISSLTHYVYCQRRCALVHTEQAWSENAFTVRGTMLHEKADTLEMELIEGIRVVRALSIWSDELGITGRADIVEFLRDGTPFPVEYKSGTKKKPLLNANGLDVLHLESDIQLCAQALCLEEMLHKEIPRGAVYHAKTRRRRNVEFDKTLREATLETIRSVKALLVSDVTPEPVNDHRCPNCSLLEICVPDLKTLKEYDPFVVGDA